MSAPSTEPPAAGPIPPPPGFPVVWDPPEQQALFWTHDRMHFPDLMTPLDADIMTLAHTVAFNQAMEAVGLPLRYYFTAQNGYGYTAIVPLLPEQPSPEMEAALQEHLGQLLRELQPRWETAYLPEVQRHLRAWEAFDLQGAERAALVPHLEATWARLERCWHIHFAIAIPMLTAMSLFDELYRDLFGAQGDLDAYRLLQGQGNASVDAGVALWRLSRQAQAIPEVRRILEEEATDAVIPALQRSASGREFLAAFRAYLDQWGQRGDKFIPSPPSWIEDPRPPLRMLRDYLGRAGYDPVAEHQALAAERERATADAHRRLESYPEPVRAQFAGLLGAAQFAARLQEDHNYWIDQRAMYQVRRVLLEVGRRCVTAGVLAQPEDAFFLTYPELRATLAELPTLDRRALIAARRAAHEQHARMQPPLLLGTLPPGPPPDNPIVRAAGRFFGAPPQPAEAPGTLRGAPGSKGTARGTVKVVRALSEAGKLRQGDILVAETTAPPWTPLFATAAAVVTDTGGVLSHCAIVAREYAIPAVVGVGIATHALRDGQIIEVDGDAGIVRIIDAA